MIKFTTGNILKDKSEALVNTVNCVGVMGKGLALQFKKAFPDNFNAYKKACDKKLVATGNMFVTKQEDMYDTKWIINFPTKKHWRGSSNIEYIENGLVDLVKIIKKNNINSIAIPPLGSGLGGLDWSIVKEKIMTALATLENVDITVYEPSRSPSVSEMPIRTKKPNMTKGRALLLKLLEFYHKKEYECTKIDIQKLAYFLQEAGQPLKLNYEANKYGPYAKNLNNVLHIIDGHFIEGYGDGVAKSEISVKTSAIEEASNFLEENKNIEAKKRLKKVEKLIDGYETPLSMEVLATVHWVVNHEGLDKDNVDGITDFIQHWNEHKASIKPTYIHKALNRLKEYAWI
ncbi:macro domain-containing protein [Endozoicomonas sp. SM1973]|uniref:Macro domain-containing protein n=1 Tax=Spartinivicinus marinus TaxID=2994442 RepID=A0A853IID4_9GAMM|nr:macro domain-containing protein [Spartinivicinus marinus]MCX4025175.1 macro domain-containing protein [Spartinivicinus marinus]NYZ69831.1 macro domain-containing protein [Spartinivicinus marinus]